MRPARYKIAARVLAAIFLFVISGSVFAGGWSDWFLTGALLDSDGVLTVAAPAGEAAAAWQAWPDVNLRQQTINVSLRAADWNDVAGVELVLSAAGNFEEFFGTDLLSLLVAAPASVWLDVSVPAGAWHATAGASWNRINAAVLRVTAREGRTALVQVQDLQHGLPRSTAGFVTLAFDDGWIDTLDVGLPVLAAAGLRGTAYVIPDLLGQAGYLTETQVSELHEQGWDIAGHGETPLTDLPAAAVEAELRSVSKWLQERKYRGARHYAYPNGMFNAEVLSATGRHFDSGRTINPFAQSADSFSALQIGSLSVYPALPQEELEQLITDAVEGGEWLVITFHRFTEEPRYSTEFPLERFQETVTFLQEHDVAVLTVSEAWEKLAGTARGSGKPPCKLESDGLGCE